MQGAEEMWVNILVGKPESNSYFELPGLKERSRYKRILQL
jgi:hypothetical protein